MDDQSLTLEQPAEWRIRAKRFQQVPWVERAEVARWLVPGTINDNKIDWRYMTQQLAYGVFTLWRLLPPAEGIAITHPHDGRLFIYHLHGQGLFDTLTKEELLTAAREEGLHGVMAETEKPGMVRLLQSLGFRVQRQDLFKWVLELSDG